MAWFEPNLAEGDFANTASDENSVLSSVGFSNWAEALQPLSLPATETSLTALVALPTPDIATTDTDNCQDSEDVDENKLSDAADALALQLVSLSQRAMRAVRRLIRPGGAPLTVSSPEVNGVLEDTNTLIRIINNITAPDCKGGDTTVDATTTNSALLFLALTCHQHLIALFRAICDAIYRWQKEQDEQDEQKEHYQRHSDIGPSSVAQFVMVLQLLMHLINRIDRSLLQNHPSKWHDTPLSTDSYITPVTSSDCIQSQATAGDLAPHCSPLILVQDIVGTIPNEHEKLRQVIQKLQADIELWLG
ncbi:fungal zn2-cys6 binuclear cluster domain-containing [Trichoderma arundinaceum]|uniref:Fungal zn2-cys6 binuclear cluster domain-containing n=1 Tax=Trichoderma arundinaceum TaxID=490622 RepID=A0A395NTD7_TRIAR|nr:fungal zn2-cys6 binuclear cluster domain-containing [Trichoderma arundinaceum]